MAMTIRSTSTCTPDAGHEVTPMTRSRWYRGSIAAALPLLAAALVATSGCGGAGPSAPDGKETPRSGHAALSSGASCAGTDVHTKHVNLFACTTCHPTGATYGFDVPYTFAGGTTTAGGTIARSTATAPATCSVACHSPKGAPPRQVTWSTPGPLACTECHGTSALPTSHPPVAASSTRADCQACHVLTGHMDGAVALVGHGPEWKAPADPANAQFHAYAANRGLAECQKCHGQTLAGGGTGVSCARCHDVGLPAGVASWTVHCTMCHGGLETAGGAPPKATWGNAGDAVRVGAHTSHVSGSAIAPAFDCVACHVKPADALAGGHLDGTVADVRFGGTAVAGGAAPAWDRATATCASTYCHGATLAGGTNTAPVWTVVGQGQAACGSCHGLPPPPPHPVVADLTGCATCHPGTMDATGAVVAPASGGMHLDGLVESSGSHPAGWRNTASPEFHAYSANAGLAPCQGCHGQALDGVGGLVSISCAQCHGAGWSTRCTMCHGGIDNGTGAPPEKTWGNTSAVGAHSSHVGPNPVAGAFGCEECHVRPADAFAPGHVDASVAVAFAGPVSGLAPSAVWNGDANPTCSSTYCHGNFLRGIATNTPSWIGTNQAACGTCHTARPVPYMHNRHQRDYTATGLAWWPPPGGSGWVTCDQCHDGIASSTSSAGTPALTAVNGSGPALHVNGTTDVVFKLGGSYTRTATEGTCSSMACHPGETKLWPR